MRFIFTFLLLLFMSNLSVFATEKQKPNIVLIMADDMGYSDIGCYGGEIETPNIDHLAANGVRFTQFHNTARCCPTRAALLAGLWPHQTGVGMMTGDQGLPGYRGDLNANCVTIAEVLREAGYATFMAGKWHVTSHVGHWSGANGLTSKHNWPLQRGFDRFYGTIFGCLNHCNPLTLTRDNTPIKAEGVDYHLTDAISSETSQFIKEHTHDKPGQPFFCYVAYSAPHCAIQAPEKIIDKYKGRYDKGWDVTRQCRYQRLLEMGIIEPKWPLSPRDLRVPPWSEAKNKKWQARRMEAYAAMIDQMDQGIGKIIEALKKTGQFENTLILFLSDNGGSFEEMMEANRGFWLFQNTTVDGRALRIGNKPHIVPGGPETITSYGREWANVSNTPFCRYKVFEHEGGNATPLVAHWPKGIKARGELRHQLSHVIDIMPTCVELAQAEYQREYKGQSIIPMEGRSLVGVFDNEPLDRDELYFEHRGNRAVRAGKWKLVAPTLYPADEGPAAWVPTMQTGEWELYDMDADRTETKNLAEKYPEKVKELEAKWYAWAKRCNVLPSPW